MGLSDKWDKEEKDLDKKYDDLDYLELRLDDLERLLKRDLELTEKLIEYFQNNKELNKKNLSVD